MSPQVQLLLLPSARCLFDKPVHVKVGGLGPRQVVTLRARATDERGVVFRSAAIYRADDGGQLDLCRDAALCGTYEGVEPMGLLWSMQPDVPHKYFHWTKALSPHVVKFSVHNGVDVEKEEQGGALAEATNERVLMGEGVTREVIHLGKCSAVLFTPPGKGPFPGVLDLATFASEKRGSLLSNKGFVVLSMPVFYDKPANIKHLELDYFEEALRFLQQHPKVSSYGLGVIGRSKAGDIALSLASFVPGVRAVVWINACSANIGAPLHYRGQQILSPLAGDMTKIMPTSDGTRIIKFGVGDPNGEENRTSRIPVEKANAHFLFLASEDDLNCDSRTYMESMVTRLRRAGNENVETVCYPRAGHLLEPPYGPYCPSGLHGYLRKLVMWGGQPRAHAHAEMLAWRKMEEFLRNRLSFRHTNTKAKL
ncbi:acyl-coenzyme A thioesterase 3-like [Syngnathoides biaculeatus]|uniref:acyl-coenzyme A thioesterase 3-like n=1 Tax=Syngnathoides biaculeatus TaxID=300417 RepID=UPI002ADDE9B4|nr:acyl-coenzyme A thioesterase 3-like [Syngnathoides biaculeatus]XP_061695983.1 acyl-coenzyme A thioesterase 3-like [Syngnathoides biaculeatus]